jgi:hypothetical protein
MEIDAESGVPAMIGAVQTFGDLIYWNSHVQAIAPEGVFTENGHTSTGLSTGFVHIHQKIRFIIKTGISYQKKQEC